jgi:hypothetical protein
MPRQSDTSMRLRRDSLVLAMLLALLAAGCPSDPADDDDTGAGPDVVQATDIQAEPHEADAALLVVIWQQGVAADTWLEYTFEDEEWFSSPPRETAAGAATELILGVPYDTAVTFRVVNDFGGGPLATEDHDATTGPLPDGFPLSEVLASVPDQWEPTGRFLLGSVNADEGGWIPGDYWAFVMDRQGRPVWSRLTDDRNFTIYLSVSADGDDILLDESTFWSQFDGGMASKVLRLKLDHTLVHEYATPGLHHAFVDLPDESIVWGAAYGFDEVLDKVHVDGTEERLWTCSEYLAQIDHEVWCQSNTLTWHEPTDSFLYSFYTMHTILELDHETGDVVHSWGDLPGSWGFDPVDSAFYFQHGCSYTDAGTLMTSSQTSPEDDTGIVREYELDEDGGILREVWNYSAGIPLDKAGEAHRLPGGNTLHNYGSSGRLVEVTPAGEVVWDVTWNGVRLLGRTVFVEDLYALSP